MSVITFLKNHNHMGIFDFFLPQTSSGKTPVRPDEVYKAAELKLKDLLAPSALGVDSKSLNLGDTVVRSYFVVSYPAYLSDSWLSPIINLDKVSTKLALSESLPSLIRWSITCLHPALLAVIILLIQCLKSE